MAANIAGFPVAPPFVEVRQFAHGQSNPTFLVTAEGKSFVLRKKPNGKLLPGAHQIEREYKIFKALQSSEVPVPLALGLCEDASIIGTPFYVVSAYHFDAVSCGTAYS